MKSIEERLAALEDAQLKLIDRFDALILELRQNAYPKGAVSEDFDDSAAIDELEQIAAEVNGGTL